MVTTVLGGTLTVGLSEVTAETIQVVDAKGIISATKARHPPVGKDRIK
jgi:hypothetical protein